ncbi:MAG: transcription termination/antitermination protein NusA [Flavobacteriales bacterium]|jgi:N utilization substance protein A|nr:transcription termination/antitermination protein NusA [Flavobacteriales bacterium]MBQ5814889.1 transcription termination/antitermination protein NusA [Flavobacteriales bacterium]
MDNLALIDSFSEFKESKKIDRVTLTAILEEVFRTALKKKFGTDDNFNIIVNPDKGDMQIWRNRVVVADGEVEDPAAQIPLSEARKIQDDFEVGEDVSEEVKIADLGRRAILALRQNLQARIFEHDNATIMKRFENLQGTIITGEVHHDVRHKMTIIHDDYQNELVLPREEQIPGDVFRKGEPVRALVKAVEIRGTKPSVILSRTDPRFLELLFEQEIPEIADGLIMIKKVVRIPGEKAKVAVESYDDRIDPVGACVGMKGSRIHGIVRELCGENIDVINYTTNLQLYVTRALAPAHLSSVEIDEEKRHISVYVAPDEVSKAIGKNGQNIRLATKLVGYEIDVYREGSDDLDLSEFSDEIEQWVIDALRGIGCDSAKSVLELSKEELIRRTDLEEETVDYVINVISSELEG